MTQINSQRTPGAIPGTVVVSPKIKLVKIIIFIIPIALVLLFYPIISGTGPWLQYPGLKGPYLSWVDDPKRTMTISWETPEECDSIVNYGLKSNPTFTDTIIINAQTKYHSITLTGLIPDSQYKYQVSSTNQELWGLDETYYFRTAHDTNQKTKFVIYGDIRPGTFESNMHAPIVQAISREKPEFVINVGDLVNRPKRLDHWDRFFFEIKDLASSVPYFSALGNHEYDEGSDPDYGANYFKFFNFPQNGESEFYYYFTYSNILFITLNMSTSDLIISQSEVDWLERIINLPDNIYKLWKIVYFHVPPFSSGAHDDNPEIIEKMVPIFEKYNLTVIAGHDHNYEYIIVNNIHYIVTGGGGAPLELNLRNKPYTIYKESTFCYTLVEVEGNHMTLITKRLDGSVVQQINFIK